jgi:hypothetical protein
VDVHCKTKRELKTIAAGNQESRADLFSMSSELEFFAGWKPAPLLI